MHLVTSQELLSSHSAPFLVTVHENISLAPSRLESHLAPRHTLHLATHVVLTAPGRQRRQDSILSSTMVLTDDTDICSQLKTIAGVRVSQEWLTACRAHLRETRQPESADSILHQVLHSDLRDVVSREQDDGILRHAISQEYAVLPENFRLMVQVEELLDVSLNAEARLSVGPASPTAPTPVGNQRMRCLKLYLSDGYHLRDIHLVGMEMSPIPDLSVHSQAGLKLILRGPLKCRFGIILCSPFNTTVLGGCVASLMEMQKKALEQAQRLAGVGVDPTVKALIWNPIGADEEGEQDEGEHESGDVEAAPPPPAPRAPPVVQRAPPPRTRTPPPPASYNVSAAPSVAMRPAPPTSFNQCAPYASVRQQSPLQTANPYARSSTLSHSRPTPITTADDAVVDISIDEPVVSHEVLDLITPTNNDTTPQSASIASRSQCSQSVNETDKEPMSFAELKALISRLQADQELYRLCQQKVFVVPCKMKGSHQYFNIRKKQHRDKKNKDDKYEYVMEVNMGGTSDSDGTLKCLVANDILQSHFRLNPGEMRKLSREDRAKSQSYVDEGGREAKASLIILTSWQLKLVPADEYFSSPDDIAVLQLVRRD